mmetsp:Transcript_40150/g.71465  ORF Transcript_40150/g.71465 Transcript_40150/m.71465 type:complete len:225 (-) Transcript_40150:189-863(-)|eukprot:CAMPEP_0194559702 /NCGR_PEP_ID=MMETSP0292-20121207/1158_1 /TAXON_ID=39354 /ORGANISM="Heterosigma akashiwo, Strain CCMP2393" /LENGTH=224 /DNA_ID=CAMNT_0039407697 /DNA_START=44 /DNA_END=718 /DNA_ORIENTATION=-
MEDTTEIPTGGFKSALRSMETTHKPLLMLRCKVVVVGDACVGKSALTQMFHSGGHTYPKNYIMTIGVDFCVKQVNIPESNAAVELYLFDCAGQSIFNQREVNTKMWENTAYVVVMYDVSNRESFRSCAKWLQGVRGARASTPIPGVLIANKADLREGGINSRADVTREEGEQFARDAGLAYFETSAAQGIQVDAPFEHIAKEYYSKYEETVSRAEDVNMIGFMH